MRRKLYRNKRKRQIRNSSLSSVSKFQNSNSNKIKNMANLPFLKQISNTLLINNVFSHDELQTILDNGSISKKDITKIEKSKAITNDQLRTLCYTKSLTFICSEKGGVGKSQLCWLLANQIVLFAPDRIDSTLFVDLDNETQTSTNNLKFVKAKQFNLVSKQTSSLDRSKFIDFLEMFLESSKTSAICDLGAITSAEFKTFLEDEASLEILSEMQSAGVKINIACVVSGESSFPSSCGYAKELLKLIGNNATKYILCNRFFPFSEDQEKTVKQLAKLTDSILADFDVVSGHEAGTTSTIHQLMLQGKSLKDASKFTQIKVKKNVINVPISF